MFKSNEEYRTNMFCLLISGLQKVIMTKETKQIEIFADKSLGTIQNNS